MKSRDQLVEGLLHMAINSGELQSYPTQFKNDFEQLVQDFFFDSHIVAFEYVKALIKVEIYGGMEVYLQFSNEELDGKPTVEQVAELDCLVEDTISTVERWTSISDHYEN